MGPLRPQGLVQEKDQKLFQLPPLFFCMEHHFKHCTSKHVATHTTHEYSMFLLHKLPTKLKLFFTWGF